MTRGCRDGVEARHQTPVGMQRKEAQHWPGTCSGAGVQELARDSSLRAGALHQADLRAAGVRAGLARAELTGDLSGTGHTGTQRGGQAASLRPSLWTPAPDFTPEQGPPQLLQPDAEFVKCLLRTELGPLAPSCTGRRSGHPCFTNEETKAERVKKAPEGEKLPEVSPGQAPG